MLLPSALTCDSSQSRSQQSRSRGLLFASPPLSPAPSPSTTFNNLFTTCRALQSMLTTPIQLPSPPTLHAELPSSPPTTRPSPTKLRLRIPEAARKGGPEAADRKRIAKRTQREVPRGLNKRRRAMDDDISGEHMGDLSEREEGNEFELGPSTPKRTRRIAPEILPLGLERSDFHSLHLAEVAKPSNGSTFIFNAGPTAHHTQNDNSSQQEEQDSDADEEWSTEEDRLLVELVLEKLKLSKSEWQDCARSLGKDRGSVGSRWKSLMGRGEVGLKGRKKSRVNLHSTWR